MKNFKHSKARLGIWTRECSVTSVLSDFFATLWTVAHQDPLSVHGDSPAKNTGVGCHALLQGNFLTQGSNPHLLNCRWIFVLSHQGNPGMWMYTLIFGPSPGGQIFRSQAGEKPPLSSCPGNAQFQPLQTSHRTLACSAVAPLLWQGACLHPHENNSPLGTISHLELFGIFCPGR